MRHFRAGGGCLEKGRFRDNMKVAARALTSIDLFGVS